MRQRVRNKKRWRSTKMCFSPHTKAKTSLDPTRREGHLCSSIRRWVRRQAPSIRKTRRDQVDSDLALSKVPEVLKTSCLKANGTECTRRKSLSSRHPIILPTLTRGTIRRRTLTTWVTSRRRCMTRMTACQFHAGAYAMESRSCACFCPSFSSLLSSSPAPAPAPEKKVSANS